MNYSARAPSCRWKNMIDLAHSLVKRETRLTERQTEREMDTHTHKEWSEWTLCKDQVSWVFNKSFSIKKYFVSCWHEYIFIVYICPINMWLLSPALQLPKSLTGLLSLSRVKKLPFSDHDVMCVDFANLPDIEFSGEIRSCIDLPFNIDLALCQFCL